MVSRLQSALMTQLRRLPTTPGLRLIGRLLGDQGARHWKGYAFAVAMSAVAAWATALTAWIMKDVINDIFVAKKLAAVWFIAGAIVVIYTVKGFSTYGEKVVLARIANNIVAEVQRRIFDKMLAMNLAYYNVRHSTEFVARQAFISQSASGTLNMLINAVAGDVLTVVSLSVVMIKMDPLMAGLALVVTPAVVVGIRKLGGRVKKVMLNEFYGFASIIESLQETVQGIRVVKAFALEPFMRARQSAAIASFERAANKLSTVGARSSPLTESLGGVAIAIVIVYGGLRVIETGRDPGSFFSFITALILAFEPAKRVARTQVDLTLSLVGVEMLFKFLDEPVSEAEHGDEPGLVVTGGRIEFRKVNFFYRPGEPVLRDLDLVAEPGATTALVGRSGGGKTTTMNMILRFYEPGSGAILIDGQDIAKVSRASLRRQIAYVSQETFLFKGSVRENIAMGRPGASRDEIVAAAKAAYAHDFISGFERGYDSPCGEHGMQLSGGQRQRIAIARAFLKNAPIILLDEATSALDSESEKAVQAALQDLCAGRTTLVIAHRLTTIVRADRICVIEQGRLVESGRHDELLAAGGAYARLHQTQFHGEVEFADEVL
ncbi:MAG: ABC transporter ATP-binding protein [Bradyrhizobium sp.]|nr:MAG: ABC transporter ATP-binding protein [Bradyrhizobium sp.]